MDLKELLDELNGLNAEAFEGALERVKALLKEELKERGGYLLLLPADARLTISGDLHGDLEALLELLRTSRFPKGERHHLILLGDYGDRGPQQVEVYYLLLLLKGSLPRQVHLLRGNHEAPDEIPFSPHDLPHQLAWSFRDKAPSLERGLRELYKLLPVAALVKGKYLLVHGGPPSEAKGVEDIERAPLLHPHEPHFTELLWNDPSEVVEEAAPNWRRGVGMEFGKRVSERVLELVGARAIIRAHEPRPGNLNHDGLVLTLFSSKIPYGLPYGAYLELRGDEEPRDASDLLEGLVRF